MLLPVIATMLRADDGGLRGVFEGRIGDSPGLRIMILGFWIAVAAGSISGLLHPVRWAPLLALQVLYKAVWLVGFALPAWRAGGASVVPTGITLSFLLIVTTYPFAIVRLMRA